MVINTVYYLCKVRYADVVVRVAHVEGVADDLVWVLNHPNHSLAGVVHVAERAEDLTKRVGGKETDMCIHIYTQTDRQTQPHTYINTCMYTGIYTCVYIYIYIYIHIYSYIYIHMHICISIYLSMYLPIYIYLYV